MGIVWNTKNGLTKNLKKNVECTAMQANGKMSSTHEIKK